MGTFFHGKNKKEILLLMISVLLAISLAVYSFYAITGLVKVVHEGIDVSLIKNGEIVRFNLKGLEELKKR